MDRGSGAGEVVQLHRAALTVAVHGEQWLSHLLNHGRSKLTESAYRCSIRYFSDKLRQYGIRLEDVGKKTAEAWIADMRVDGLSLKTINSRVGAVKVFYEWLCEEGCLPRNPLAGMKPIKLPKKLPRILAPEKIVEMSERADTTRDSAFVATLYASGGRLAEVLGIDLPDLNLAAMTVLLKGKGGVERIQPLSAWCVALLQRYLPDRQSYLDRTGRKDLALFISREGRLNRSSVQLMLDKLGKRVGIGHVHAHQCRHSLATAMLRKGMNLRKIQKLMGHASITSTEIYTHVADEDLRDEYNRAMG
jgi:site-specific recombinase XerD